MARKFTEESIDDYQNRLTEQQKQSLIKHCNKYEINPEICAWYDNMKDFYSDWCNEKIVGLTKEEAKERLLEGTRETGEFCRFITGEIVRLVR